MRLPFLAAALITASVTATADPVTFDFKDPKGVNGITFVMDSDLEPIVGMCGGVSGTVTYDPDDAASLSGQVSVDIAQISFVNPGMTKVLKGADWLNIGDTLKATMSFDSATLKSDADPAEPILEVTGTMSLGAAELPMTVDVSVAHHADGAKARGGAASGDLLVLRSMFKLDRKALGIGKPGVSVEKVGEEIMVMVPVVGYSK